MASNPVSSTGPSARKGGLSPMMIIFLTVLIDMIGFGVVIPILPLYSEKFGATPTQIGLLVGSFSAMQLLFAPVLGRWSDRMGRRPILIASLLGTAVGFLILGLANTLWLLFLGRIIDGISGGNISTAQAYIADITTPEKRARAMGLIGAAFGLGFVLGPAIGGLLGHVSIQAPFLFSAALAVINVLAIYFFLPESLPAEKRHTATERRSLRQTFQSLQGTPMATVMLCYFLNTIAFAMVTTLFTLFTEKRFDWHARENGMIFAYIGVLGVVIQGGLLGRLIKRCGEKPLIILGTLLLCVSMALLPTSHTLAMLILASSGLAIGNGLVTPVLNGWASRSADPKSQGSILGLMQGLASLGRLVGPIAGGLLLHHDLHRNASQYGITPFMTASIIMALAVIAALALRSLETSARQQPAS